jgi:hypothetical protein
MTTYVYLLSFDCRLNDGAFQFKHNHQQRVTFPDLPADTHFYDGNYEFTLTSPLSTGIAVVYNNHIQGYIAKNVWQITGTFTGVKSSKTGREFCTFNIKEIETQAKLQQQELQVYGLQTSVQDVPLIVDTIYTIEYYSSDDLNQSMDAVVIIFDEATPHFVQ